MRRLSPEASYNSLLVEELRTRVAKIGRWHMKGRRADATRIWKMLFKYLEKLLEENYPFTERAYIKLWVYPSRNVYSFVFHHHTTTSYKGYLAKRENDYMKIIVALNNVLSHYNLILEETPESLKSNFIKTTNGHREYAIKFAKIE